MFFRFLVRPPSMRILEGEENTEEINVKNHHSTPSLTANLFLSLIFFSRVCWLAFCLLPIERKLFPSLFWSFSFCSLALAFFFIFAEAFEDTNYPI